MPASPTATVIVLNYNGEHHLRTCLPSLEALDYPATHITVVDNGSSDRSIEYLRRSHPSAAIIRLGTNRGFAAAYNIAIRQAQSDLVAILNNDARVARSWLSELVASLDRHQAVATSSMILDWEGAKIDFAGALPTFLGHSWQLDHGEPVGLQYAERPLLFASGGSMLIRRDAFLEAGGFDEDYFAYFEDVDLGWRLNVLGHRIVFAPQAITYHRLHGTASGWAHALRLRLYERNGLATVYKNYGDEALSRVLPAAVTLTVARALDHGLLDGAGIEFGKRAPDIGQIPAPVVSTLIALEDFGRSLPALATKRRAVQSRRAVPDEEIFALFPNPLRLHEVDDRYLAAAETLIRDFGIAELFGLPAPSARVTVPTLPPVDAAGAESRSRLVSIVVLTASGPRHLPQCLDSLRHHDWPASDTEVIVVDNGSSEDPTAIAERHYPGVRVIRTGNNLGFAGGNNVGARSASGDWLIFLNDDTRVAPGWIDEMMAVAARRKAAAVGALLTDWTGERVDFAGGLVNFEGRGYSLNHGKPVTAVNLAEGPLLFACGAAVLFRRDIFERCGGWDEGTFAYYEDVELGWRLWLLGYEVWFAPRAIVYHKHHGTSGGESPARARALERNALRMLYTHLEERTLKRVLPAALLLAIDRPLLATPFSRAAGDSDRSSLQRVAAQLRPGTLKIRLLHALSRRGARRQMGTRWNLRRVGAQGLVGAMRDVALEIGSAWQRSSPRTRYQIERTDPNAAVQGRSERVAIGVVAALLGIRDFIHALPELSARRAGLQSARRRSDAEIIARFGDLWMGAVPSPQPDMHVALRNSVIETLGLCWDVVTASAETREP
jgi:GT2 family glycosyltransferase